MLLNISKLNHAGQGMFIRTDSVNMAHFSDHTPIHKISTGNLQQNTSIGSSMSAIRSSVNFISDTTRAKVLEGPGAAD
jgi:hypothetical protein